MPQSTHNQTALYRFYGDTGQLLYVGITADPGRRFAQHAATKNWWAAVRGISLDWYTSREDALEAEKRAIKIERPLANIIRPADITPTPRKCGHCWACAEGERCIMRRGFGDEHFYELEPCGHCGDSECLYVFGHDQGSQAGWRQAADWIESGMRGMP